VSFKDRIFLELLSLEFDSMQLRPIFQ